ncbi:uncharacterized protein [Antedon mediterranea]
MMPSQEVGQFKFVYADSRKNGRIIGTSKSFSFGLDDDFTEIGPRKKDNSLNTPYLQLQLNSNCNNNNDATDPDEEIDTDDDDGKDDQDGNVLSKHCDEEEKLDGMQYDENSTTAGPEPHISASNTEDEYVIVGADAVTVVGAQRSLGDSSQGYHQTDDENDVKIDEKPDLSRVNDQPVFDWSAVNNQALVVNEIDSTEKSSQSCPLVEVAEVTNNKVNQDVQTSTQTSATYSQTKVEESMDQTKTLQKTTVCHQIANDLVEDDTRLKAIPTAALEPEKTNRFESEHMKVPDESENSVTNNAIERSTHDFQQQTAAIPVSSDPTTQYVQYSTADGDVCWAPILTNEQIGVDLLTMSERLTVLETQFGQWIPYLNSRLDHLTNSHQLLFDDCNVQKANISDLSERIHQQQHLNGAAQPRDSWATRRYGGSSHRGGRNTERDRRYNEQSQDVVGYYEYYNKRFGGRGRGHYRRDHQGNGFSRQQDDQRRGYYQQNRRYEDRHEDINHSGEDEIPELDQLNGTDTQRKTGEQKEEKVVITSQKA